MPELAQTDEVQPMDEQADLCIREPIGKVLEQIQVRDKA